MASTSIRVFEIAEAIRPSLEIERSRPFTRFLPVRYTCKEDHMYDIEVNTEDGVLNLTVQQTTPADCVKYISHAFQETNTE